jgi:peroxiredoxin
MNTARIEAPEILAAAWLNTPTPLTLESLRGQVVALHAFQMLCPGCVSHGIPQAVAIQRTFAGLDVQVLGLHCVFEHHDVMGPAALRAFVHEYRLTFPIAIDRASAGSIPQTMQAFALQGTPSLVLIDRAGRIRASHFGRVDDMQVGASIGELLAEPGQAAAGGSGRPAGAR